MIAGFFIGSSVGAIKELLDKQGEGVAETNNSKWLWSELLCGVRPLQDSSEAPVYVGV